MKKLAIAILFSAVFFALSCPVFSIGPKGGSSGISQNAANTFTADQTMGGTTPNLTIGDAGAEDAQVTFDGNAQDFHIGLDDSVDDLVIGVGSALGTTQAIGIDENTNVTISGGQLVLFSRTAAQLGTLSPISAGSIVYCSNCATANVCVSTGTGGGAWVRVDDGTTSCD